MGDRGLTDPRLSLGSDLLDAAKERVLDALDTIRPIIYLDPNLGKGAATASAALAGMLGRLFPHTTLEGDGPLGPNPWGAFTVQAAFEQGALTRPTSMRSPNLDLPIGVGTPTHTTKMTMGGDAWTARLGTGPQPIDGNGLSLGLHAAAALLASEVTKQVLGPLGFSHHPLRGNLVWNVFDYSLTPTQIVQPLQGKPLRIALFGAGSIGSSVAGVLSCTPELTGEADIVDGDTFDPEKNPYRYPSAIGNESGSKALWISNMLGKAGWQTHAYNGSVAEWVTVQATPGFDGFAISSVDSVEGRLQVADVLARNTLSLGVAGLALHLQRETLGDDAACPFCDFVDVTPALGQAQVWAQLSGLSIERVTELLVRNSNLRDEDLQAAVQARRLRPERATSLIGRRLVDLIGRVYAEAEVKVNGEKPVAVSAPYVSWMGAVLAVAELAKAAYDLPLVDRRVDLDITGIPGGFTLRRPANHSGRCTCSSPVRRRWMRRMYIHQ